MAAPTMHAPIHAARPWYRHLWPWLLIAGPAIVVVAALITAWLAVWSDDGVIADDYYKRGLLINKELERSGRGEAMKLGAVLRVTPEGAVRLEVSGFADAVAPAAVRLKLAHPTRAGRDRQLTLARDAGGAYSGMLDAPPQGRWLVSVETDVWRLPTVVTNDGLGEVRIGAARAVD
jgi:uncharacterized protein